MQKNINFGSFPDDPSADAIRTAFQKSQDNFTEVYSGLKKAGVLSISPGTGISLNSTVGNIVVSSNISNVNIRTSSLSIGVGANGKSTASLTKSSQTLVIDLPPTITTDNIVLTGNASFGGNLTSGNATLGNLAVANYFTGNLTNNVLSTYTGSFNATEKFTLDSAENLANNTSVNVQLTTSYFSSSVAETAILGAGTNGQIRSFIMTGGVGSMAISVTNPGWNGAGTMTFSAVGAACTMQFLNNKWYCIGNNGVTFA